MAIARTLALDAPGARAWRDQVVDALRDHELLLVLDNLEQFTDVASRLDDLLTSCPRLTVLATSRSVLHVSGEHVVPVEPLLLPEAVQLFTGRAKARQPDFRLIAANASTITAICERLDRLPLAIELAAARLPALTPHRLLVELDPALPVLTGGARDHPARLQTMQAAIAWTYDQLRPEDQALFRRLAAFIGGFDLAGAAAVNRAFSGTAVSVKSQSGADAFPSLIDSITSLVEQNLLRQIGTEGDIEPRYQMLETIREFGLEHLAASDEEATVREAIGSHILNLTQEARRHWATPEARLWNARLDADLENVRASLRWAETRGRPSLGLEISVAVRPYWIHRGGYQEGAGWLRRSLELASDAPLGLRAEAMTALAWLEYVRGRLPEAEHWFGNALEAACHVGDPWCEANILMGLALTSLQSGDLPQAIIWSDLSITRFTEAEQHHPAATQFLSLAFANRGQVAMVQGDHESAASNLAQAIERQRQLQFQWALGDSLRIAGDLALQQGNVDSALTTYRESLEFARVHVDKRHLADLLTGCGMLASRIVQPHRAVAYFGAAAAMRASIGAAITIWARSGYEQVETMLKSRLTGDEFEAAWGIGAAWSLSDIAVDMHRDDWISREESRRSEKLPFGLTRREVQILRLIASGSSDRDIGSRLFISTRTVNYHVSNILSKLGLESRSSATAFAFQHGLDEQSA